MVPTRWLDSIIPELVNIPILLMGWYWLVLSGPERKTERERRDEEEIIHIDRR